MSSLQDALVATLQHLADSMLSQQRLDEAINLYQRVLTLNPNIAPAHYNLGNAWMAQKQWQQAIDCYRESIRLDSSLYAAHTNLGHALRNAGQLTEATNCYQQALTLQPENPIALSNLANALNDQRQYRTAIELYRRALELKPDHFESLNNLGKALCECQRYDEAIGYLQTALQLAPDSHATLCNLGVALRNRKRFDDAIVCYCKAIELKPDCAEAFCNLGEILKSQGDFDRALVCFIRALEFNPDSFEANNNLAEIMGIRWKLDDAVRYCERALELKPDSADANNCLGNAFKEQGQLDRAVACYERALELDPNYAGAHSNLGVAMIHQGRIDDAIAHFRHAMRMRSNYTMVHSNLLYAMNYRDGVSLAELADAHREFEWQYAAKLAPPVSVHRFNFDSQRPLRLGFVSADFGRHPIGYFLASVLEHLPRKEFETVGFSDRVQIDELTHRLQAAASEWHDVRLLDDDELAQKIRAERIDFLFDLSGHTSGNRLLVFARRPAPIQITWAGYVGTTGLKQMDYILADRFEIPVGMEHFYEERVLRMPDGYVCYTPPAVTPSVTPLPALHNRNVTFACFNNPAKLSARITDVWLRILQRLPDSQLILKFKGWNDKNVARRFIERFTPAVDPRRITLLGQSSHLELLAEYNRVDIALDPFPYSGGLTTCESLWMGVPVVTCPGETFASRHSLSHLSNVGLSELVAKDLDDYVERVVSLASDLPHLARLRASLRERMTASPLCDGKRFAANLGQLLHEVWINHTATFDQIAA